MRNYIVLNSIAMLLISILAIPFVCFAQAGSLDLTFGTNGFVTTPVGNSHDVATSIAIQSDGKMVVAGYIKISLNYYNIALVRYNTNGTLDTSFDNDGKVITPFGAYSDWANSIAIQSDGKIVVGGNSSNGIYTDIIVVRYNISGSLDSTFDTDGIVTATIGATDDEAHSVAIQSDDKILVAGTSFNTGNSNFALIRYNYNGSLDTTFDMDGIVTTNFGGISTMNWGYAVAIQNDGKLLVAGTSGDMLYTAFALTRYNTDGSLDTSFDSDGKVTSAIGINSDGGYSIAIQSDDKILVSGYSDNGHDDDFALVRYNTNGSLDTTFDTDGIVVTSFGPLSETGKSVAIQSDGKIVVAGESNVVGSSIQFALARYTANGSLDTTFNTDGKVTTLFGGFSDSGNAAAIQSDDKIVMVGYSNNGNNPMVSNTDFGVVRYNSVNPTGISTIDNQTSEIKIYPNPFSFSTTILTDKIFNNVNLIVFNIYGQEVKHLNNLSGQTIALNRDDLPCGVYFIQVMQDNKIPKNNKIVVSD